MVDAPDGAGPKAQAEELVSIIADFFANACTGNEQVARRLAEAETIWTSTFTDVEGVAYTIYLDRFPIEVTREFDPAAQVQVWGPTAEHVKAWTGQAFLGMQIVKGQMAFRGPVRHVLRVLPLLRPLAQYGEFRKLIKRKRRAESAPDAA